MWLDTLVSLCRPSLSPATRVAPCGVNLVRAVCSVSQCGWGRVLPGWIASFLWFPPYRHRDTCLPWPLPSHHINRRGFIEKFIVTQLIRKVSTSMEPERASEKLPDGIYQDVSKSFWTGRLERELQMVQLSATRCSCVAILWVSLVSFAAITFCVASLRVFIVLVVYFVIDQSGNFRIYPRIPNQWSLVHTLSPCLYKNHFNIILPSTTKSF
jgi:hypothetical protein